MQRINIYLPHDLRQRIQLRAERDKKPEAQVIRELVQKGIEAEQPRRVQHGLTSLAKLGIKGPKDLSQNIDKYLYGDAA
jgi:hypothetical protein